MNKRVIVVGGGAAGLMASIKAAEKGHKVTLFEKNDRLGKKILISGKGRCNITNSIDIEGLIKNTPGNGNFLYSAFYTFSNDDLISFFNSIGVETKEERGGRIFPVSDNAKDVVDALTKKAINAGVELNLNSHVKEIVVEKGTVKSVRLKNGQTFITDILILTTGGASYPGTGSTGEGYEMAKSLGHTIVELKPSLVPLLTLEKWPIELQGLTLKNVSVAFKNINGKKIYEDFGEMIFTHFGVSGPVILSASRHLLPMDYKNVKLSIDLKPALDEKKLDERILRDFEKFSRKLFKNSLDELLPQKMIPVIINLSQIDPEKPVNSISREERKRLVALMKNLEMEIKGARPLEDAIVTAGGIAVNEINPSTMESKLIKGLYFAGEIIDVDAYTGGFNLTIAFSTGYLAGTSC